VPLMLRTLVAARRIRAMGGGVRGADRRRTWP
jgi:hypothetical protein